MSWRFAIITNAGCMKLRWLRRCAFDSPSFSLEMLCYISCRFVMFYTSKDRMLNHFSWNCLLRDQAKRRNVCAINGTGFRFMVIVWWYIGDMRADWDMFPIDLFLCLLAKMSTFTIDKLPPSDVNPEIMGVVGRDFMLMWLLQIPPHENKISII